MTEWFTGVDVSSLDEVERCGGRFYDLGSDEPEDALAILKRHGANLVRLRLWNNPFDDKGNPFGAGVCDLETVIRLAKRVKAMDMQFLLNLHYSDFWTDPGKQRTPRAWRELDASGLEQAVLDYTLQVLKRCREEKVLPDMVAVGNEVSNGLLWPLGQVPNYENVARFISAGIRAVRQELPGVPAMIHLDNGGNNALYREWFDHYFANAGEDFEYIGLSFYPFWHGTLQDLNNNMTDIARRYGKKLIVAEVSNAFSMEDYKDYEGLPDEKRKGMATKPEVAAAQPYPITPEGQSDFMRDLIKVIRGIPEEKGCGFIYWEPAWLPVPGSQWATEEAIAYMQEKGPGGNEWANQALFDYDGHGLPALKTIEEK